MPCKPNIKGLFSNCFYMRVSISLQLYQCFRNMQNRCKPFSQIFQAIYRLHRLKCLFSTILPSKKTVPTDLKLSLATLKPVIKATNSKRNGVFLKLTQEGVFVVVDLNLNLLDSQGRRFIVIFYRFLLIRCHVIYMIDSCGVGGSFIFFLLLPNEFLRSVLAFAPSNYQQD